MMIYFEVASTDCFVGFPFFAASFSWSLLGTGYPLVCPNNQICFRTTVFPYFLKLT